jgi:hypothetical protein
MDEAAAGTPDGDPGSTGLQTAQQRANELLRAGQDAITRALSNNSTQYLNSMRQEGGQ